MNPLSPGISVGHVVIESDRWLSSWYPSVRTKQTRTSMLRILMYKL